ncbi:hypothetical protein AMATHDRAFT_8435 [Amanita thiersii Skay4041]|uniref:Uncharacterized protein n=1 Tax=Amanita thiersii Skay4041 TaxID=703135 RepID=A0A2A9NE11_9AGAR|nr:hypothetical protein AMATHDRAFT_8435 [Amanita thiersii Skay4041]
MATKIGELPSSLTHANFSALLETVPVNPFDYPAHWTCKTWLKDALKLLVQKEFIQYSNIDGLVDEVQSVALPLKEKYESSNEKCKISVATSFN